MGRWRVVAPVSLRCGGVGGLGNNHGCGNPVFDVFRQIEAFSCWLVETRSQPSGCQRRKRMDGNWIEGRNLRAREIDLGWTSLWLRVGRVFGFGGVVRRHIDGSYADKPARLTVARIYRDGKSNFVEEIRN